MQSLKKINYPIKIVGKIARCPQLPQNQAVTEWLPMDFQERGIRSCKAREPSPVMEKMSLGHFTIGPECSQFHNKISEKVAA